jgi:hypothetical protein
MHSYYRAFKDSEYNDQPHSMNAQAKQKYARVFFSCLEKNQKSSSTGNYLVSLSVQCMYLEVDFEPTDRASQNIHRREASTQQIKKIALNLK